MLEQILNWDFKLFYLINSQLSSSNFDAFFKFITDVNKSVLFQFFLAPTILIMLIRRFHFKRTLLALTYILLTLFITENLGKQIKESVKRERPYDTADLIVDKKGGAKSYSFPSNHAANSMAFSVALLLLLPATKALMLMFAFTIGYSRIYLGVHFPTDVICGSILGFVIAYLLYRLIFNRWLPRQNYYN